MNILLEDTFIDPFAPVIGVVVANGKYVGPGVGGGALEDQGFHSQANGHLQRKCAFSSQYFNKCVICRSRPPAMGREWVLGRKDSPLSPLCLSSSFF